jgi:hypothetical protein
MIRKWPFAIIFWTLYTSWCDWLQQITWNTESLWLWLLTFLRKLMHYNTFYTVTNIRLTTGEQLKTRNNTCKTKNEPKRTNNRVLANSLRDLYKLQLSSCRTPSSKTNKSSTGMQEASEQMLRVWRLERKHLLWLLWWMESSGRFLHLSLPYKLSMIRSDAIVSRVSRSLDARVESKR